MNLLNLKRVFNYLLENIDEEDFELLQHYLTSTKSVDIGRYITANQLLDWYSTVGKKLESFEEPSEEGADYPAWTESFLDLEITDDTYVFMFHSAWANSPETATLEQTLLRMKFVIDFGRKPLSYSFDDVMTIQPLTPYEICT